MRREILFAATMLLASLGSSAQTVGEFKPKDQSYGLDKLRRAKSTKIYISGFEVNYQVYNEKQDFKQGGSMLGGGQRGDAQAEVSVGLEGLDEATVQGITDKLYAEYLEKLKAKGLTVITADEAGKTDAYSGFMRMKGGKISMAEIPGTMSSSPSNFEYYVKGLDKDGKTKKGGFMGTETSLFPKLSKELGDAIIGTVDITVLFVRDKEAFQGNGAKLKIKTDLRIISTEGVVMTDDSAVKFKGQNTVTTVTSNVSFYHGKVGAGATTSYVGSLSRDLGIDGVIDETSVVSAASGGMSQGVSTIYGTFYSVRNGNTKNAKVIPVDREKYKEGVYAAASKFLAHHTDEFLKSI
jgi:hypothetical protein